MSRATSPGIRLRVSASIVSNPGLARDLAPVLHVGPAFDDRCEVDGDPGGPVDIAEESWGKLWDGVSRCPARSLRNLVVEGGWRPGPGIRTRPTRSQFLAGSLPRRGCVRRLVV